MALKSLWVEQHRPASIDEVIFADDHEHDEFKHIVKTRLLPNLLLVGTQGTGKTTISKALVNDLNVDNADVLKINCAEEQIDAIRNKVRTFAYTMPMGDMKIVRLEEMDYLSHDAQGLLRDLIESTSGSCRFVATANYQNKIMPAIQSRFDIHQFSAPDRDQVLLRMADVLVKEGVEFEVEDLEKVVAAGYPDLRKVLILLEKSSRTRRLVIQGEGAIKDWKLQLLPLFEAGDIKAARKLVCESATREELVDVFRFVYDNLHRIKRLKGKEDQAVVLLADYMHKHAFAADGEINIAALFIELDAL